MIATIANRMVRHGSKGMNDMELTFVEQITRAIAHAILTHGIFKIVNDHGQELIVDAIGMTPTTDVICNDCGVEQQFCVYLDADGNPCNITPLKCVMKIITDDKVIWSKD